MSAFTQGAFGPLTPIQPVGIDKPGESGRPDPRRWQYPVGWNLPVGQPGTEGIKLATFSTLRAVADMFSVARSCVNKRVQEIIGLEWDIVPTDEAEHAMRGDDAKRGDWEKRRAKVHDFFEHPDADRGKFPTWGVWVSSLLEDLFVLDAVAVHLHPPRVKGGGPFGSNLASLDLLDGSTIRPMLDLQGSTPPAPDVAYQQYIWGVPRVDLTSVMMGVDLEGISDTQVAEYRSDQLMYLRYRPRNWTPYGFGPVEEALLPIMIGLARQQYQWDYFQDGSIPGQFVVPGPDVSTPAQIRDLQDALNAMAGDVGSKHRIVVLPPGSSAEPQKPPPLADQFDEWIISQVAMPFGLTPMDLGVTPRVSAMQSPGQSGQLQQVNQTQGRSGRIEPVTSWLKQVLFDYVIKGVFGQDDMQFSWGLTEDGDDEETAVQLHVTQVQNALESIDEARVDMGHTPWGLPETSVPLVFTPTGPIPIAAAAQQAQAGADQAQVMADMARDGKVPPRPGHGKPDAGPTDEHGEPTTPAHEGAEAAESGAKPQDNSKAEKALRAELQILTRHLSKGRPIEAFRAEVIPAEILANIDVSKGVPEAVAAVGYAARRALAIGGMVVQVAKQLGRIAYAYRTGAVSFPAAVDGAVAEMREGYHQAMAAGSEHAAADHHVGIVHFLAEVSGRAQLQRGFVSKMLSKTPDAADIGPRLDLYGSTLHGAYNEAYGKTVEADGEHDYEIVWRLGHTEHCKLCMARDGRSFTFDDLPGWPGDGGFGELCEGGPNCGCHLDFVQRRLPVRVGVNTQRPDAVAYYAEQNARIGEARQDAHAGRERFLHSIPGDAAARAAARDTVREQLAEVANQAIRQAGGYGGISVEPADIPAAIVAELAAGAVADVTALVDGLWPRLAALDVSKADLAAHVADALAKTGDLAGKVYAYLADTYPADTLAWVRKAHWRYDDTVPLSRVDMDRRPGGRDQAKVRGIAQAIADGKRMDPVVLVDTGDEHGLQIADGYHRTLAFRHAGRKTIPAYVASGVGEHGPWDREMHDRKLNKLEAALAAAVPDTVWELFKGWDPGKHPRGPDGRFIGISGAFHSLEQAGGEHRQHQDLLDALGDGLTAHFADTLLSPDQQQSDVEFNQHLRAITAVARQSKAYSDEQLQQAMDHINHLRAEMSHEKKHEARVKLAISIGAIIAGLVLSIFLAPVLAGALAAIPLIGEELPKLLPDVTKELAHFKVENPARFRERQ